MLVISGILGGVQYDEAPVSVDKIREALGIPAINKYAEFRVSPERVKTDGFGQIHFPPSTFISTVANIQIGAENAFTLRYTENRKAAGAGTFTYSDTRIKDFVGQALALGDERPQEREKYVFFYLNPRCSSSPAYTESKEPLYFLYDRAGESEKTVAKYQLIGEIGQEILTMDNSRLRIKAAGLRYRTAKGGQMSVDASDVVSEGELRGRLSELLHADPQSFADAWRDDTNHLRGLVMYGIEKGVILQSSNGSGSITWRWSDAQGGREMVVASRQEDPFVVLLTEIATKFTMYVPKLNAAINALNGSNLEMPGPIGEIEGADELTNSKIKAMTAPQIVAFAVSSDVLYFDRMNGELYYVNGETGEPDDQPVFTTLERKEWQRAFSELINDPINVAMRKELNVRVTEKTLNKQVAYFGDAPGGVPGGNKKGKNK